MNEVPRLKIGRGVMGNAYVCKDVQAMCKKEVEVTPIELIVIGTAGKKSDGHAIVVFENGSSISYQLALSLFENPPAIDDLKKVLPFTERMGVQSRPTARRGRLSLLSEFRAEN
ncbi:MAG: hypothetical protein PHF50_01030 [Patescibacteria group bacterium]|nr:hypothetical protein [Patescibacteria group bacterium]